MERITYTVKTTDRSTGAVIEEVTRPAVVSLTPSSVNTESAKVRVSVRDGGPRVAELLAAAVRPFNLKWVPGPAAWDTKGAWGDERTHAKITEVLVAAGFGVDDQLSTTKGL